jgi:hypothetical protein
LAHCDAETERCVECRYWEQGAGWGDADCPSGQTCSYEGYCGDTLLIANSDPVASHPQVNNDVYALSLEVADCWIENRDSPTNQMCTLLYLGDHVDGAITESAMEDAFTEGRLDFLDGDHYDALDDLWGQGVFNQKNLDWRSDPTPGSFLEYCVWYDVTSTDEVFVDKCSEFSP